MPLHSDDILGTEKDGSKTLEYCKYCYQNGKFTNPGLTLDKMISRMTHRMDEEKIPEELIEDAIARLPKLKRWKKSGNDAN